MTETPLDNATLEKFLRFQRDEIDGYHTYLNLAEIVKDENHKKILTRIAGEEMKHYEIWKTQTQSDVKPNWLRVNFFSLLARLFGLTFGIKLMEIGEEHTQENYADVLHAFPEVAAMQKEEEVHEEELVDMLNEEALKYAGSVVLGLNDALVELTGTLAGLTFAFQNTRLIALAGLITGIAASFSMAASEYLSQKSEGGELSPIKSATYTGIAYIFTVLFLVLPYFIFSHYLVSLAFTIVNAVLVIAVFNFYISVAKGLSFRRRFIEMTVISLGVAAISFVIGSVISKALGVDI
jgi:VIT1/CCC1 family predicted Fe2+/Mn2+ transporter